MKKWKFMVMCYVNKLEAQLYMKLLNNLVSFVSYYDEWLLPVMCGSQPTGELEAQALRVALWVPLPVLELVWLQIGVIPGTLFLI